MISFYKLIPAIGSDNNNRRVAWLINQLKQLPDGYRLLDAGAGTQYFRQFCPHFDYVAQDFASYIPDPNAQGLQNIEWNYGKLDIISDITDIPAPDNSFDAILCSEVLEHIPYPEKAIVEFSRLLRPGGTLLITAPFCSLTHQSPYFFATGFSRFYYNRMLQDQGFENIETLANGSYFEYMAQESKRLNGISRKYAGKPLSLYQKIITGLFLRILDKLNKKDKNSSELLCFSYFVKAGKKQ
ncbi:MAG: class I SAM-dependent methyltransferase [Prevotella sp.]|jgi:ubiquinone/menaquinone biosynthesis C-methylase UbiE|nr:class I SAM-dependent methyltransferase [Prevotella sp.]